MNIYLLNRSEACGYDEYDAKVIVATSKDEARKLANMKEGYGKTRLKFIAILLTQSLLVLYLKALMQASDVRRAPY